MPVLPELLISLAKTFEYVCVYYFKFIFFAVVFYWLESFGIVNMSNKVVWFISKMFHSLTDWLFNFIRRFVPPIGVVDITPMLALIVVFFAAQFVPRVLYALAQSL